MGSRFWRNAYLLSSAAVLTLPTAMTTLAQEAKVESLDEIVVTARRREESAQETPVSVSVLSADDLYAAGIKEIRDLTAAVPGVNMTVSGGSNNTVFSIRGRSRSVIGNAQPSVASYVNEVPLSIWGASIPTYDIASIQVLKGPQGTLFGRNTTTGAVLVTTGQPTHDFSGYAQATFGRYSWQQYEGAVNIPLMPDKLALRVAGQVADRDGYTKNVLRPSNDFDDMNRDNFRVSLLIEPVDGFKNVTVYERNNTDEIGSGVVFYEHGAGAVNAVPYYNGTIRTITGATPGPGGVLIPTGPACNGDPACDINVIAARQEDAGERRAWADNDVFIRGTLTSWSNTTSFDLGPVTLKNIYGYREVYFHNASDIDGTELAMINADNLVDMKQTTDEFQVTGTALNDTLNYIVGYFYSNSKPNGDQRLEIQQFAVSGTPLTGRGDSNPFNDAPFNGAFGSGDYFHDKSKAYFGQVGYKLSGISDALSAFSVDLGVRRTKDEQSVCTAVFQPYAAPAISEEACKAGAGVSSDIDFKKTTYTFGINYQATDNLFIYGVTRKGYRAGGINTPVFGGILTPFQVYDPETVNDYELGLKSDWQFGDVAARLNLAVFESKFKDVQAGLPVGATGANDPDGPDNDSNPANDPSNNTFYVNAGKATVDGIEVEAALVPIDGLEFSAGGAWLDKKIDDLAPGLPVPEAFIDTVAFIASPDYSYNFGVSYTLPLANLGDLRFGGKYFKISEVEYGSVVADSYDRADFRIDWQNVAQSGVDAGVFVTNAFDQEGVIAPGLSSEGLGSNSAIYNEPRIYGVQVRYQFGGE